MKVDLKINGALYNGVPAVLFSLPDGGKVRFCEVSDTTATAADVAKGKRFYDADGNYITGTATGGGGTTDNRKSITVVQVPHQKITVTSVAVDMSNTTDANGNVVYKTEYQDMVQLVVSADDGYNAGMLTINGVTQPWASASVPITDGMVVSATDATKIVGNSFDVRYNSQTPMEFGGVSAFLKNSQSPSTPNVVAVVWYPASEYPLQIAMETPIGYDGYTARITTANGDSTTGTLNYYNDTDLGEVLLRMTCDNAAVTKYFNDAVNNGTAINVRIEVTP